MIRFYEPWWYDNGDEDRDPDLATASKTFGQEHDTLEEANEEIIETDPDQEAFVNVYEKDSPWDDPELVAEYDDPRNSSSQTRGRI
jgi:hypothetical protein